MHIEDWPLAKIRPYPNNPRVLRNAAEKVAESITAFGWRQPIVVDAEGVIIIGHSRYAAAQLLKLKTAPVHVAEGLTPDQVRALRVADNKTGEFSGWDDGKLADELKAIMDGLGTVAITGFSQSEFDALEMEARAELDRITAPRTETPAASGETEPEETGTDDGFDETEAGETGTAGDEPRAPELVAFNVLLTVEARQVVFDAVAKAKQLHSLETTADAVLVIARRYADA